MQYRIKRGRNSNGLIHSWLEEIGEMSTNEQPVVASNVGPITHPRRTIIDEAGNTFHVEFRGSLTTVSVRLPNGIKATGNARLYEGDVYSKEFGEQLASVRASQRALKKYERWLAKQGFSRS